MPDIHPTMCAVVLESLLETIGSQLEPQDVFAEEALERWAEQHGYIRPE